MPQNSAGATQGAVASKILRQGCGSRPHAGTFVNSRPPLLHQVGFRDSLSNFQCCIGMSLVWLRFQRKRILRRASDVGIWALSPNGRVGKQKVDRPVTKYSPERIFSLDVECVAIGTTHEKSSRAPCELALVDGFGKVLLQTLISVPQPIVSFLTPFTGLKKGDLERGNAMPLDVVVEQIRQRLPANAILVGQNPAGDFEWTGLRKGIDFEDMIDLAEVFRGSDGTVCSLQHEAFVLLDRVSGKRPHDPVWDAAVSVELYHKAAQAKGDDLAGMRRRLRSVKFWPPRPSTAKRCGFRIDGVCLSLYSAENCSCGKPIERSWF